MNELKILGQGLLEDKKAMNHPNKDSKIVRFVTLWSYNSWQDSYNKEFDSEWYLLGLVNPRQIAKEIVDKK